MGQNAPVQGGASYQQIIADPEFYKAPVSDQALILGKVDPEFAKAPEEDQHTILHGLGQQFINNQMQASQQKINNSYIDNSPQQLLKDTAAATYGVGANAVNTGLLGLPDLIGKYTTGTSLTDSVPKVGQMLGASPGVYNDPFHIQQIGGGAAGALTTFPKLFQTLGAGAIPVVSVVPELSNVLQGKENWKQGLAQSAINATTFMLPGGNTGIGTAVKQGIGQGVGGYASSALNDLLEGKPVNQQAALQNAALQAIQGAAIGGAAHGAHEPLKGRVVENVKPEPIPAPEPQPAPNPAEPLNHEQLAKDLYHNLRSKNVEIRVKAKTLLAKIRAEAKDRKGKTGRILEPQQPQRIQRKQNAKTILAHLEIYTESVKEEAAAAAKKAREEASAQLQAESDKAAEVAKQAKEELIAKLKAEKEAKTAAKAAQKERERLEKLKTTEAINKEKARLKEEELQRKAQLNELKADIKARAAEQAKYEKEQARLEALKDKQVHKAEVERLKLEEKARKEELAQLQADIKARAKEQVKLERQVQNINKLLGKDNANTRAVLETKISVEKGTGQQKAVAEGHLTFDQVQDELKDYTTVHQAWAKVIDKAMQAGKRIVIKYRAENAGHTSSYDVKEVTPYAWEVTQNGKVTFKAYNPDGHETTYHLYDSAEGSHLKTEPTILDTPGFKGVEANVYHGPQEYKLNDVLNRPDRPEPVKDSEIQAYLQQVNDIAQHLKEGTTPVKDIVNLGKKSIKMRKFLVKQGQGELTASDLKQAAKEPMSPEDKAKIDKKTDC